MKITQEQARRIRAALETVLPVVRQWVAAMARAVRAWLAAVRPLVELIRSARRAEPLWVARLDGRR